MKKPCLQATNLFFTPRVWITLHLLLIGAFVLSLFFARPLQCNTSLFDILPPSHALKSVSQADAALSANTSRAVTVLAYSEDFASAKRAAEGLYFARGDFFDDISLYVDARTTEDLTDFLFTHRFLLLDDDTIARLENGGAVEVAQDALSRVYGAFSLTDFSCLEADPFDLTGATLMRFLGAAQNGGAMSVQDDVLAAQKDGVWYVLLRGTLKADTLSLAGKKSAVKAIFAVCEQIVAESHEQSADDGQVFSAPVQFAFSGVPFHSYESSSSAQRQVSVISTIGLLLVVLLFLYVFRSLVPALVSAAAVALSCAVGLVAVVLFFRQIHILTFVFGTTLIGTCVDYSIHFFVHWKGDAEVTDGAAIRARIVRGIGISFASTEICFAALFLAPFPFLKQVAVFLFCGLLCAFLTVVCLYPLIPLPSGKRTIALLKKSYVTHAPFLKYIAVVRCVPLALFLLAAGLLAYNRASVKIDNNLRDMYTMSARLLESEKTTAQVLDYGSAGWYFLVEGATKEAVLQTEEAFSAHLLQAQAEDKLGSYLATSSFIPSQARQACSYQASAQLLPLVDAQYDALGFADGAAAGESASQSDTFFAAYQATAQDVVAPDGELPAILQGVTKNLWLGELDGRFYSCILPLQASDEAYFRALAADAPNIHFVNKVADVGAELNALTTMMLKLLALAFVLIAVILCFCYPPKTVARIAAIPVLVALVTVAVLSACAIPLGFFSVTGLVLVFGLGLDYIIYAVEGEKADGALNNLAIVISFATTALSFGALALISFAPVHTIGLTVFVGLTTACGTALALGAPQYEAGNAEYER